MASKLERSACCFVVRDGKVLSVSRKENDGALGLPGGHQEPGEKESTTAARETWEETGVVVTGLTLLHEGECEGYWCSTFLVRSFFGEPRNMGEGMVSWVYPEQLLTGAFGEYNRLVIAAWKKMEGRSS